ncbi:ornithine carbamoyltransferase [Sphaerosporella brunnea]|uniref:Ornithine carbamoyltransferase, mitochondrial n=1 Tax=Sphaerosporella brunnea TaxID=1250544 RepID=A0A5J5F2H9_9PEZI|nr:ornithine carbamoyltransferase [Sphaerosporella brunnea]
MSASTTARPAAVRLLCNPLLTLRSISTSSPAATSTAPRHFLSIGDLTPKELSTLVRQATKAKHAIKAGTVPESLKGTLTGKTIAMMFSKRSTRTRVSTEAAVVYMGGHPMFLGKDDIQLGVNESLYDTSVVISSMTSCIVARVGPHSDIAELAKHSSVPVINALSDLYHPLQAVTDIMTISEAFPSGIAGLKVAWVGDANNVLYDLMIACAKMGINVSIATPANYPVDPGMLATTEAAAKLSGSKIEVTTDPIVAVRDANVIVTDTWVSMGQESEKKIRLAQFEGYQVSTKMAAKAHKDWKFMHCLPRKPEEVTNEVFYSDRSLVFTEAENRLYAAIAALEAFVVKKGKFEEDE